MSFITAIADQMNRLGDIQAQRAARTGAIWGGALQDMGQLASKTYQEQQQAKIAQQEAALRTQQMSESQARMKLATDAGARDTEEWDAKERAQYGAQLGNLLASAQRATAPAARKAILDTYQAQLANLAAKKPDVAKQIPAPTWDPATPPADEELSAYVDAMLGPEQKVTVPGVGLVGTRTQKVYTAEPVKIQPLGAEGGAVPDTTQPGGFRIIAPPNPKSPTGAEDDAKYEGIIQKQTLKQPLTPEESAFVTAYEKRKTLGVDATASAAADRQTKTIQAQVDQQRRAQDFTELQAGRADLEKNVTTPFLTAQSSANTLRDVVTAAKAGNKVAGSLQALEATMSAIRAQGLNRINTAEIGATGNAGSMYDHVIGWLGKAEAGQPVPPDVQNDMLKFSDILEKAAYKKYLAGHESTRKLYPALAGVQPLPDPFAGAAAPPPAAMPKDGTRGVVNGRPAIWTTIPGKGSGWVPQ